MPEKPKITDAEFEVVRPSDTDLSAEISKHLVTVVVSVLVFAGAFYLGVAAKGDGRSLYIGAMGVSFAAAVKSGWSLFAALRRRRSAK